MMMMMMMMMMMIFPFSLFPDDNMYRFLRQVISRLPAGLGINGSRQCPLTYSYLSHYYPSLLWHEAKGLSSLYVSERTGKESGYFNTALDGGERLKDIDGLRKTLKRRGIDMDLDKLVIFLILSIC